MTTPIVRAALTALAVFALGVYPAQGQDAPSSPGQPPQQQGQDQNQNEDEDEDQAEDPDDAVLRLAEPDYRLVNLPTALPMPRGKFAFELTHRFVANLARGSFAGHAKNLFGLDQGALIGFELRAGLAPGLQAIVYRASLNQTFQFQAKYEALRQRGGGSPIGISALASVEGLTNFTERRSPALGAVVSHTIGERAAAYAVPLWVHNTGPIGDTRDTAIVGVGGRVRVSASVYVVGEVSPRVGGYAPGRPQFGVGIEKRAGGHLFQLNFTNSQGTTLAQTARGGTPTTIYLGFNLARKFF